MSIKYELKLDQTEVNRCLLCDDAPCTRACPKGVNVADVLRSVYFENYIGASQMLGETSCAGCSGAAQANGAAGRPPCEAACLVGEYKRPIDIRSILLNLKEDEQILPADKIEQVDLTADICGVKLENPFLLSSSVVASSYEMCARAFDMGWAGISFKTICNFPQHEASPRFAVVHGRSNAFYGFKNIEQLSDHSVEENMSIFRRLKENYPTKVIVASIMGQNEEEWAELARACQENGADVIECNFSCPNMEDQSLGAMIGQSPELVERFTRAVKSAVSIPVLAKLTPNVTDMVVVADAARRGGADGIAAINTINSITGVNVDTLTAEPTVNGSSIIGGYSGPAVKPIALRFITELSQAESMKGGHVSGMGGIETWRDAAEFIMLGAGSLQITTAVMQYGYRIIDDLVDGLAHFLKAKGIDSVSKLIGCSVPTVVAHTDIERDTVLFPVFDRERCIGCGRCFISCRDGGHQAIEVEAGTRMPKLIGSKCVGCHLCRMVCPVDAIHKASRRITR